MNSEEKRVEINKFVMARLKMAQELLEESDALLGFAGYGKSEEDWHLHPRHEREGLVVYLLLTCFDKIGQNSEYADFQKWINSRKYSHEREEALESISTGMGVIDATKCLLEYYNSRYGVKRAFENGINQLESNVRSRLMSTLRVLKIPVIENPQPNTLYGGLPVPDERLVEKIKIESMFQFRNKFTHSLVQFFRASAPFAQVNRSLESSWVAEAENGKIRYWTLGNETIEINGVKYGVTMNNWPFVLFKTLYSAIGVGFDVTTINLKFMVKLQVDGYFNTYDGISHAELKAFGELPDSLI
jgi:hypothetical protein